MQTIMKSHTGTRDLPRGHTKYIVDEGHQMTCTPEVAAQYAEQLGLRWISPIEYYYLYKQKTRDTAKTASAVSDQQLAMVL